MFPEFTARFAIDTKLAEAGWIVQDHAKLNVRTGKIAANLEHCLGAADEHKAVIFASCIRQILVASI